MSALRTPTTGTVPGHGPGVAPARRAPADSGARRLARLVLGALLVGLLAAAALLPVGGRPLLGAPLASANGVPTVVQLSYLDGLSNWGPREAHGEIELVFAEGFVRLVADGLAPLTDERYQGWIVNSETNDAISVGRFNANADGEVQYQGALPPIADFGFDLFIITVEPEPDDAPQPTTRRSIGGHFSLVGLPAADGSSAVDTSTAGVQRPAGGQQPGAPQQLPNTGDALLGQDLARVGALALVASAAVVLAVRRSRARTRTEGTGR